MNPDGTQVTQVTDNVPSSGLSSNPSWSPDSTKIAFEYFDAGVNQQIRTINVDGTGQTLVTTNGPTGYAHDPSWSPDGQKIAFHGPESCCTDNSEVYTVNVDGTGLIQITNTTTGAEMPHWQPLVDTGGDDLVITDCDDPALATVTTVTGDLVADAVPGCDEISLPNLTSVTGSVTITDNQVTSISIGSIETTGSVTIAGNEVTSISLSSGLLETTGSVTIAGNEVTSISIGSMETTGSVTIADNGPATSISLESVGATGSITIESTGTGTFATGSGEAAGSVTLDLSGYDQVQSATGGEGTSVSNATAEAMMRVVLPDGAYETAVPFTITHHDPSALPEEGTGANGSPATIDPVVGYEFLFDVPTLNADATLTFDVLLDGLDTPTRDALLAALDTGQATLATRGDGPTDTYQAFALCAGPEVPTAGGCVKVEELDASGQPTSDQPTIVRFTGVTGHFSDWAVAIVTPAGDATPPVIDPHDAVTTEASGADGALVNYDPPTAVDAVDGPVDVTCAPPSGSTFALGTTTVDCSATDAAGNTATAQFDVIVSDTTPPALTLPATTTAEATGPVGTVVDYEATADDVVDGDVVVTCTPPSGSVFSLGSTTVECTAIDAAGNTGVGSFMVTVHDLTAPTLHLPSDQNVEATSSVEQS